MHSLFGAKVNEWLLQLRKSNAAVVLATQSVSQLERLPNRHTIVDSCITRIYLPNADAATPAQAGLYRDLGLNEREIGLIARAVPKRDYYFKSPRGSRVFELGLGPIALAFLATPAGLTVEATKRRVETLITEQRENWVDAWLMERGLQDEAERLDWVVPSDARTARTQPVFAEQGVLPL
jgi:type IV secretion system protein VirB4